MPLPFLPLLGAAARVGLGAAGLAALSRKGSRRRDDDDGGGGLAGLARLALTAGRTATSLALLAAAAPATVRALQGFSAALLYGRRDYVKVSGSIAGAFARLERQQLLLDAKTAAKIGPGTVTLAKAYGELQSETQKFNERRLRLGNVVGTVASRAASSLAATLNEFFGGPIDSILDYLEELVGIGKGGTEAQKDWRDYFRRLRESQPMNKRPGRD